MDILKKAPHRNEVCEDCALEYTDAHTGTRRKRRRGMRLSLFIVRYFVYVLLATIVIAGSVVSLLTLAINSGVLYPANYASINRDATVGAIEERGTVVADDVPSCYRWGIFNEEGRFIEGDFDARAADLADSFLKEGAEGKVVYSSPLGSPVYAISASLEDGLTCVLVYDFNPVFTSKSARDTLPDPQGTVLCAGAVTFAAALAGIAVRASYVLRRKLAPISVAAKRIGNRELDFDIAYGNVRETNDALSAIDSMRISLKESLEEQWAAEQAQRESLSSLAHDLKTPLTVVRGNADLLLESSLDDEQRDYAMYIRDASRDMEGFIGRIIEVSREAESAYDQNVSEMDARCFCGDVEREAKALAKARDCEIDATMEDIPERAFVASGPAMVQAAMNLIDNAFEYGTGESIQLRCEFQPGMVSVDGLPAALKTSAVSAIDGCDSVGFLRIVVENEGAGFSTSVLKHAGERFYRADSARSQNGHHGLGLAIAKQRAESCGGGLVLENTGRGARASLLLPCYDADRRVP